MYPYNLAGRAPGWYSEIPVSTPGQAVHFSHLVTFGAQRGTVTS